MITMATTRRAVRNSSVATNTAISSGSSGKERSSSDIRRIGAEIPDA
jgi:hypothetical protein